MPLFTRFPASQPLLVMTPGSPEDHPPKLQGLRLLASDFRALVLSHLGKWQRPPGSHGGQFSGSSRGFLVLGFGPLLRLRDVGVYAWFHFSPVTASVPAGPRVLLPGGRVSMRSPGTISNDVQTDVSNPLLPTGLSLPSRHPRGPGHRVQYHHGVTSSCPRFKEKKPSLYPVAEYEISYLLPKGHYLK